MQEFEAKTQCGRRFVWSAQDAEDCKRHMERRGYIPIYIKPYKGD